MLDLNIEYEVVIFSIGETKAGTKMGKLQLKNLEDDSLINCVLWEETLNRTDQKIFRTGNILKILCGSYNEKFNNCIVSSFELIKEAKLGISDKEADELYKKIEEVINKFENKELKKYVSNLVKENKDRLKIAPAAKLHHHNYVGGLIVHIGECIDFADVILKVANSKISREEVLAACILHDFGKIFEYTIDLETGLIGYDEEFRKNWFTHSQWGYSNCMINGFVDIAKMIAAHHSRLEWGAIIDLGEKNLDPMMYIIHHIDDLSAKFGKISINDL